ncbi:MAG: Uma2 family endonuclease [Chloroflexi bacterium]|nr:Uma2 family endonuclease [Chloroflexota bacterium]
MSTPDTFAKTAQAPGRFRLPDIPEKHPDDMTSSKQLAETGNMDRLKVHLDHPEATIVSGERYVCAAPGGPRRYPDLLVAFSVDPERYEADNGYVALHQGKPPDLVLEIASSHTGHVDVGVKRDFYERLGIPEYWRFDQTPTGQWHGARLAGSILVEGQYEPIEIEELPDGSLQGYSPALNLYLRWVAGILVFYDPSTGQPIASLESERARADAAEVRVDSEREGRVRAEARNRELEEELRRLRGS